MEYLPTYLLTIVLIAVLFYSYRDRQDAREERAQLIIDHMKRESDLLDRLMARDFQHYKDNVETDDPTVTVVDETKEEGVDELEDAREELEA